MRCGMEMHSLATGIKKAHPKVCPNPNGQQGSITCNPASCPYPAGKQPGPSPYPAA